MGANFFAYCANNPVNSSDSTGLWFGLDDLVAGLVGAAAGITGQFISDLVVSAASGKWTFSNWQTYTGAAVGGALGGIATIYAGPIAGGMIASGYATLLGQTLENITGEKERTTTEIIFNAANDATFDGVLNAFLPVDIPGITSGPNNYFDEYLSALTKIDSGITNSVSFSTVAKGYTAGIVGSTNTSVGFGIKSYLSGLENPTAIFGSSLSPLLFWCSP